MKFNYFKFPLPKRSKLFGWSILKPIIPLEISHGERKLRYNALIDSGADLSIIDGVVGDFLGLDVRSGDREVFGGVQETAPAEAFLHRVKINIGGHDYETKIGFSYDIAKHGFGLLGQKGFFDLFIVKFDLAKEEVELKARE